MGFHLQKNKRCGMPRLKKILPRRSKSPERRMSEELENKEIEVQNNDVEASKGYWTNDTPGYLDIAVLASGAIVLSSCYWYRVQIFQLSLEEKEDDKKPTAECWNFVKALLRECGRKLPTEWRGVYTLTNLSLQQTNQIYYLLKHNLTSSKVDFELHYGLFIDKSNTVVCPPKAKKRRLRNRKGKITIPEDKAWH